MDCELSLHRRYRPHQGSLLLAYSISRNPARIEHCILHGRTSSLHLRRNGCSLIWNLLVRPLPFLLPTFPIPSQNTLSLRFLPVSSSLLFPSLSLLLQSLPLSGQPGFFRLSSLLLQPHPVLHLGPFPVEIDPLHALEEPPNSTDKADEEGRYAGSHVGAVVFVVVVIFGGEGETGGQGDEECDDGVPVESILDTKVRDKRFHRFFFVRLQGKELRGFTDMH